MLGSLKQLAKRIVRRGTQDSWIEKISHIDFISGLGDFGWLLYGLCRCMNPEVCVEIGSARGKSTCFIARALKENNKGRLFAIDPHTRTDWNDTDSVDSYALLRSNLGRLDLDDYVTVLRETSAKAAADWHRPIDLLFIDGDHSYEGVKNDWKRFVRFVKPFGIVIFHDTLWELAPPPDGLREDMGVPRFVDELRQAGYPVFTIDHRCGLSLVQPKVGGIPLKAQ